MNNGHLQEKPLVSVLLPVYDPEPQWLHKAVNSVMHQTYNNKELIIVDDGSPTPALDLLEYDVRGEGNVTLIKQENKGFVSATNRAFREAEGQYVAPIAQDDFWENDKLQKQMAAVKNGADAVFGQVNVVDENGDKIGKKESFPEKNQLEHLFYGSYPIYESLLLDTKVVSEEYLVDEEFKDASDWDLWFRIWPIAEIRYLDDHIATKRRHSGKISVQNLDNLIKDGTKIINKYSKEYDFDSDFRSDALSKFYRRKGVRLFKRGEREDARNLWKEGLSLDTYDPKTQALFYLSLFPPIWRIAIFTYSIFDNVPDAKVQ